MKYTRHYISNGNKRYYANDKISIQTNNENYQGKILMISQSEIILQITIPFSEEPKIIQISSRDIRGIN